jgi:hypothetical protein
MTTEDDTPGEWKTESKSICYESSDFQKVIREMGPSVIDSSLRQSIWMVWMALPEAKREIESFKKIIRDRYERILSEIEDDIGLFQINMGGGVSPNEQPNE